MMGKTHGLRKYRRKSKRVKTDTKPFSKKSRKRVTKHKKNKRRLSVKNRRTRRIMRGSGNELQEALDARRDKILGKLEIVESTAQDKNPLKETEHEIKKLKNTLLTTNLLPEERVASERRLARLETQLDHLKTQLAD